MRLLTLSCFSLLWMGCSFIFVRPPPSEPEKLPYFDCVSNAAAPASDLTNVVGDGLLIASALDEHQDELAVGVSIAAAVYAASAIYGFVVTSSCASAKERLASRVHETRVERDALLKWARSPAGSQPGGCRGDVDCKGDRVCVNAICVNPSAAPTPAAPPIFSPFATPQRPATPPVTPPPAATPPAAPPLRAAPPLPAPPAPAPAAPPILRQTLP